VQDKPCNFRDFQNEIHWQAVQNGNCNDAIVSFNVYFSETGKEGSFKKIANTTDTFYIHRNLPQIAGCYKVSAVSGTGQEAALSEKICHDNCPYYELPNVFTPNDDGINDLFKAFNKPPAKCPRFVKSVTFQIFNRYGMEVYNSKSRKETPSIYIDWNGCDSNGTTLPVDVYFYSVKVNFNTLDPSLSTRTFKGWVKLTK
jgi:gliding motility-associated-like protein